MATKRQVKNVESVVNFFSRKNSRNMMHVLRNLGNPFVFNPEDAFKIMELYAQNPKAFEAFATYARHHPKVSSEITLEDLVEAHNLLQVKHVMES